MAGLSHHSPVTVIHVETLWDSSSTRHWPLSARGRPDRARFDFVSCLTRSQARGGDSRSGAKKRSIEMLDLTAFVMSSRGRKAYGCGCRLAAVRRSHWLGE